MEANDIWYIFRAHKCNHNTLCVQVADTELYRYRCMSEWFNYNSNLMSYDLKFYSNVKIVDLQVIKVPFLHLQMYMFITN